MTKADLNLMVIQNFILHITHSSEGDGDFKTEMSFTPEQLYIMAEVYIEEDHVDGKDNPENIIEMKVEKPFPNSFGDWCETYYEVVKAIEAEQRKNTPEGVVGNRYAEQGYGGLYEFAEELTDEFERTNQGRVWDGDFFDTIDEFMQKKLFP